MHRPDARAGQHRNGQFRNQRQVQRDPVAFGDAERLEHVGELGHLTIKVEVGQRAPVSGFALPDNGRLVSTRALRVPINAVHAGVQLAANEPLCVRRLPIEHLRPRRRPFELSCEASPERLGIALRFCIDAFVLHAGA